MYQCLFAYIFLCFLIFCFSLQVQLTPLLLSQLCISVLFFCYTLCYACHVPSMHHSSSVYFIYCTLPPSTHLNHSQQQQPYLIFCIIIISMHLLLLYAPSYSMLLPPPLFTSSRCSLHSPLPPLHPLEHQHTLVVLHVLLVSSPLPHHHHNSSAFLVVIPMRSSSLGVMQRYHSMSTS
jgi:hypothetical protein